MSISYKDAGVDVDGGNNFVRRIAPLVKSTFSNRVITGIGGFSALYDGAFPDMKEPILVSSTDGVGTKLKIAQKMAKHDTIGIDAVAMCVNDLVVCGAQPLFFLDYIACGRLNEDVLVDVVKGLVSGCAQASCSLIGGETAEHPNVMEPDDYDIAGFTVGVVDRKRIINGDNIIPGDIIIGITSSGIHSNGYSLVRKLFFDTLQYSLDATIDELPATLGEVLLEPTKIYVKPILSCINAGSIIKGMVHITGGGFYENIPRILPPGTTAVIDTASYTVPAIFSFMQKAGDITAREMYTTFNMGIGMMLIVEKSSVDKTREILSREGEQTHIIGEIVKGDKSVILK